jgi:GDP-L-fucose synthase
MPPNLYGPGDDFDPDTSHVIPGLIRKFVLAKDNCFDSVEVWGTGKARREFLYVDDLAQACLYFMNKYDAKGLPPFLNVGYNSDISIKGLVSLIVKATGYKGKVVWDRTMPDGMARKLLSLCSLRKFKWKPKTRLEQGIKKTVNWYKYNQGIK